VSVTGTVNFVSGTNDTTYLRVGNNSARQLLFSNFTNQSRLNAGHRLNASDSSGAIVLATAGTDSLTIAPTGAATFSNSVTAASGINAIGQQKAFSWQRTTGTASDVYSLNADSVSTYLQNDTTSNILTYWSEGGNVGIGTTSVSGTYEKLAVAGGISIKNDNNAKLEIGRYSVGVPNSYIKLGTSSNSLRFTNNTDAADLFIIENGGNVGIGTNSPGANFILDINSTKASGASGMRLTTQSTSAGPILVLNYSGASLTNWGIGAHQSTSGALEFVSSTSAGGDPATVGTVRMLITSGGNVGIGTTEPGVKLDVIGDIRSLQTNNTGIAQLIADANNNSNLRCGLATFGSSAPDSLIGISRASNSFVYKIGGALAIGTENSFPLILSSANTQRMRIAANGEVTFGVTAAYDTSLLWRADFTGTIHGRIFATGAPRVVVVAGESNGVQLTSGATSWSSNSDERLKNINGEIENAVEKLLTLRTVKFSWKSDESNKENLGLIAQDVEKEFPQVIDKGELAIPEKEQTNKTEYLSIRYTELIPVLIKAIQELKSENDNLKSRLEVLEQS
jgi:hypothetical protein